MGDDSDEFERQAERAAKRRSQELQELGNKIKGLREDRKQYPHWKSVQPELDEAVARNDAIWATHQREQKLADARWVEKERAREHVQKPS